MNKNNLLKLKLEIVILSGYVKKLIQYTYDTDVITQPNDFCLMMSNQGIITLIAFHKCFRCKEIKKKYLSNYNYYFRTLKFIKKICKKEDINEVRFAHYSLLLSNLCTDLIQDLLLSVYNESSKELLGICKYSVNEDTVRDKLSWLDYIVNKIQNLKDAKYKRPYALQLIFYIKECIYIYEHYIEDTKQYDKKINMVKSYKNTVNCLRQCISDTNNLDVIEDILKISLTIAYCYRSDILTLLEKGNEIKLD